MCIPVSQASPIRQIIKSDRFLKSPPLLCLFFFFFLEGVGEQQILQEGLWKETKQSSIFK